MSAVRCLGLHFNQRGIDTNQFRDIVDEVEHEIDRAKTFHFSLNEKVYLIKCILVPKFLYAARMMPPQGQTTQRLTRAVFGFFWEDGTERLARDAVRFPRRLGGMGIPCLETMGKLLALRTLLSIMEDVNAPERVLAL